MDGTDKVVEGVDKLGMETRAEGGQEMSKNAQKKAAKQEKLAQEKASKGTKSSTKDIGKAEAKTPNKQSGKKREGAALISIDVAKEDDFPAWYARIMER